MQGSHYDNEVILSIGLFFGATSNGSADRFISHLHFLEHSSPTLGQNDAM